MTRTITRHSLRAFPIVFLLAAKAFGCMAPQPSPERPPSQVEETPEPGSDGWDAVFRRVEFTKLHGKEAFPVYCVDRLLREAMLKPGAEVLVIAMGDGRNAVPFAMRGLNVTGLDISTVALEMAEKAAAGQGVKINAIHADIFQHNLGREQWDLVTNIYFNPAIRIFDRLKDAVRPGGFLLVEGFGAEHKDGPPAWSRYRTNQLLKELDGWRILEYQDGMFSSDWADGGPAPVVRVLARKPEAAPKGNGG